MFLLCGTSFGFPDALVLGGKVFTIMQSYFVSEFEVDCILFNFAYIGLKVTSQFAQFAQFAQYAQFAPG